MLKKILLLFIVISFGVICLLAYNVGFAFVIKGKGKTYIVDRKGDRWDVTQAQSIGFRPERFQYGIGRNTIVPLDDSNLSNDTSGVSQGLRVIGITEGSVFQAYSVRKLSRHEIANTKIDQKEIAVGY